MSWGVYDIYHKVVCLIASGNKRSQPINRIWSLNKCGEEICRVGDIVEEAKPMITKKHFRHLGPITELKMGLSWLRLGCKAFLILDITLQSWPDKRTNESYSPWILECKIHLLCSLKSVTAFTSHIWHRWSGASDVIDLTYWPMFYLPISSSGRNT